MLDLGESEVQMMQITQNRGKLEEACNLDQLNKSEIAYQILQSNSRATTKREQIHNLYFQSQDFDVKLSMEDIA